MGLALPLPPPLGLGPGETGAVLGWRELDGGAFGTEPQEEGGLGVSLRPWEGPRGAQRMGQPLRRLFLRTWRPARVAISNTSRTPSLVLAEHSR